MSEPPPSRPRFRLDTRHAIYELEPNLLLIHKPQGHEEARHAHAFDQELRVLRGRLRVDLDREAHELDETTGPFTVPAGVEHATTAVTATWIVARHRS